MEWGDRLREERERLGLSQRQLAGRVGLYQSDISRIEKGGRPLALDEAVSLAAALGVPLQWFLTGTSRPGKHLPALELELRRLGAVDLRVEGATVPGAFRPP
ncbi:MAG: helix-turn-helix domain-containing protein, partial [Gemmataceae bacterium]